MLTPLSIAKSRTGRRKVEDGANNNNLFGLFHVDGRTHKKNITDYFFLYFSLNINGRLWNERKFRRSLNVAVFRKNCLHCLRGVWKKILFHLRLNAYFMMRTFEVMTIWTPSIEAIPTITIESVTKNSSRLFGTDSIDVLQLWICVIKFLIFSSIFVLASNEICN